MKREVDTRSAAVKVLAAASGKPEGELRPEQDLVADLGIDSPRQLELLIDLEEALGVEITDEEAAAMETVGDVLDYAAAAGA